LEYRVSEAMHYDMKRCNEHTKGTHTSFMPTYNVINIAYLFRSYVCNYATCL